jgi:hypothetical protein
VRDSVTQNFLLEICATPTRRRRACAFLITTLRAMMLGTTSSQLVLPIIAEGARFELAGACAPHAFQACALDHYANPPCIKHCTSPPLACLADSASARKTDEMQSSLHFIHSANPPCIRKYTYYSLPTSALMRSAIGGWVINSLAKPLIASRGPNGLDIYKCAVALLARSIGAW